MVSWRWQGTRESGLRSRSLLAVVVIASSLSTNNGGQAIDVALLNKRPLISDRRTSATGSDVCPIYIGISHDVVMAQMRWIEFLTLDA